MEVLEVTQAEYKEAINPPILFNAPEFNSLNAGKIDSLCFLLFKDSRIRMGLIGGIHSDSFKAPFSAPFGGFTLARPTTTIKQLEEAVEQLISWCSTNGLRQINLVPPPLVYDETNLSKLTNVLFRAGFNLLKVDLNYTFFLKNMHNEYVTSLPKNARKNLKNAQLHSLDFLVCNSMKEKEAAYHIIKINRKERGFPLRMTWDQVHTTLKVIPADFFIISGEDTSIASAIVFHVAPGIVQVIYWGDLPEFSHLRPMNFLAYEVFNYYKKQGMQLVDIGPSTENSIPNHGLCDFKESLGCDVNLKTAWSYQLA